MVVNPPVNKFIDSLLIHKHDRRKRFCIAILGSGDEFYLIERLEIRNQSQPVVRGKGEAWKNRGGEGWKGGKKSESVSQTRKRKLGLTAYAIGIASMEDDFNSLNFFIVEQQK